MGNKGRGRSRRVVAQVCVTRCCSAAVLILVAMAVYSTAVGMAGARLLEPHALTKAATSLGKPDALCDSRGGFPGANERTVGNTTYLNRQLSVYEVLCTNFGKASEALPRGDVFCTLLAAAIGVKFDSDELYVGGACASKAIVTHEDRAGIVCGGLVTLVGAVTDLAPELKVYAVAAGVACDVGHSLGSWIETGAEAQAAKAVWRRGKNALEPGQCLKFVTHGPPTGDDWLATPCSKSDSGFADLAEGPKAETCSLPNGVEGGGALPFTAAGISCAGARAIISPVVHDAGPCLLSSGGCQVQDGFVCRDLKPYIPGQIAPGDPIGCALSGVTIRFVLPG
jgi:hypothetical protein